MVISKESRLVDVISAYFGTHVLSCYARHSKKTKTGKVNLKSLVTSEMLEEGTALVRIGEKSIRVNILQIGCWIHGIDIAAHGVTRTSAINPIRDAIVEYLKANAPEAVWEKVKEPTAPRVSLDSMLANI